MVPHERSNRGMAEQWSFSGQKQTTLSVDDGGPGRLMRSPPEDPRVRGLTKTKRPTALQTAIVTFSYVKRLEHLRHRKRSESRRALRLPSVSSLYLTLHCGYPSD